MKRSWMNSIVACLCIFLSTAACTKSSNSQTPNTNNNTTTTGIIQKLATPVAFSSITGTGGADNQPVDISGAIALNSASDGIDLTKDRVVINIGTDLTVIEAGEFTCSPQMQCLYSNPTGTLVQAVGLNRVDAKTWNYHISGGVKPAGVNSLLIRIANDWGGIELGTSTAILSLQIDADTSRLASAMIGTSGGSVYTSTAGGVWVQIDVPEGALKSSTTITLTPLNSSPLAVSSSMIDPGVQFQPAGLKFETPATLTMSFGSTPTVAAGQSLFLVTSPLSVIPVLTSVNAAANFLTATIYHFSEYVPGVDHQAMHELAQLVNEALQSGENFTREDLQTLVGILVQLQLTGHDAEINITLLDQKLQSSFDALASTTPCDSAVSAPSNEVLQQWIDLDVLGEQLGVDTTAAGTCQSRLLETMINQAGNAAIANPSDENLTQLRLLETTARQLGFSNLEQTAVTKLASAIRALFNQAQNLCNSLNSQAWDALTRAYDWACNKAPEVLTVDPNLETDILNLRTTCQAPCT